MKNLLKCRFNGPAAILISLLAVNAVITFIKVNLFLALIQVTFSLAIAFLGNKAEIWSENDKTN